ncbi:LysR family transcriptional regulator [Streptobacillus felis]|uniref:LysR family transcriptional regulator n=1 Tax=Streptobacillus felis TaxID=1384509 RepID=A0A7Z0PDX0_9FUSO|nr:LysR family transcriptional regulator [Streptobacillus felis]NYV27474.1 LysR family transcriptional regulator [Streptobacillus felis]
MDINNIKAFIKLIEFGTISKTASELFITQSALSKIINKLENELDTVLLIRTNKGVSLTKEGQIVYNYFKKILFIDGEIRKELKDIKENVKKLKIVAVPSVANYSLPCVLYNLNNKFENMKFPLFLKNSSSKIVSDIADGIVDIGFVSNCQNCEFWKIKYTKAYDENIILVASNENKINNVSLDELSKFNYIQYIGDDTINEAIEEVIPNYSDFNIITQLESIEAIKKSVSRSNFLAFLPYSAVKTELYRKELKSVEIINVNIIKEIFIARRFENNEKHKEVINYIEKFILDTIC